METLRAPDGCPWDRVQTHDSIKSCFLEEAYEFIEALENRDEHGMAEELGDVLLQVVFHARMAEEAGKFSIDDVIDGLCDKLIRRHPHVFGELKVKDTDELLRNWETIKNGEEGKEDRKSRMDGIPANYPALLRAGKVQSRAAKDGFDWKEPEPIWEKLAEEEGELHEAIRGGKPEEVEEEFGDLLFTCVNLGRRLGLNAETSLLAAAHKFERRYRAMEAAAEAEGKPLSGRSLDELDELWNAAKVKTAKS